MVERPFDQLHYRNLSVSVGYSDRERNSDFIAIAAIVSSETTKGKQLDTSDSRAACEKENFAGQTYFVVRAFSTEDKLYEATQRTFYTVKLSNSVVDSAHRSYVIATAGRVDEWRGISEDSSRPPMIGCERVRPSVSYRR
jgi:hypothetical protein